MQHKQQKAQMNGHTRTPSSLSSTQKSSSAKPRSKQNAVLSTLSLPSEYLAKYRAFILNNSSSVSQIESALRSLTYLIPGRFRDAEIASESLHSGIQLLSMYHDSVLFRAASKLPGMPKAPPRDRYTKYWMKESPSYRRIGTFLQVLRTLELWFEMLALRRSEKVRWRVVILLESLKAMCRIALLRITGWRMGLPPLPDREPIPEQKTDSEEVLPDDDTTPAEPQKSKTGTWSMPRTGLTLPTLPNPSDISNYLLSKVLTAEDIKPATNLLTKIQGPAQIAEILHIMRPVIYAIAMSRSKDKKSWHPWLLGISMEIAARQLRKERPGYKQTQLEREEWNRRGWAMGWWALRGGFYENVTKSAVEGIAHARFMPGLVGGIIDDYAYLWSQYSASSNDF